MNNELKITSELRTAVNAIKTAILQSQYRAAKGVNCEQLSLYFGIGRYISEHSRVGYWGTGAIERISEQLQRELPGLRGFSAPNLKFMRQFYESWAPVLLTPGLNSIATAIELKETESVQTQLLLPANRLPMAIDFDFEEFVAVSFTHHLEILHKTTEVAERLFYIHQAFVNQWDKYRLRDELKADLYHHQGTLPNNFGKAMPDKKSALKALQMKYA